MMGPRQYRDFFDCFTKITSEIYCRIMAFDDLYYLCRHLNNSISIYIASPHYCFSDCFNSSVRKWKPNIINIYICINRKNRDQSMCHTLDYSPWLSLSTRWQYDPIAFSGQSKKIWCAHWDKTMDMDIFVFGQFLTISFLEIWLQMLANMEMKIRTWKDL